MKRLIATTLTCIGLACASTASASFLDANDLYSNLRSNSAYRKGFATGLITGVASAIPDEIVCIPDGATIGQLKDIVEKNLAEYPELRHLPAEIFVEVALIGVFPCEKTKPSGKPL